jgi:hypothetical protein
VPADGNGPITGLPQIMPAQAQSQDTIVGLLDTYVYLFRLVCGGGFHVLSLSYLVTARTGRLTMIR